MKAHYTETRTFMLTPGFMVRNRCRKMLERAKESSGAEVTVEEEKGLMKSHLQITVTGTPDQIDTYYRNLYV